MTLILTEFAPITPSNRSLTKKQRYVRPSDWLVKLLVIKTNVRFMDNLEIFRSGDSGLWPLGVYFWTISMEISDLLC